MLVTHVKVIHKIIEKNRKCGIFDAGCVQQQLNTAIIIQCSMCRDDMIQITVFFSTDLRVVL